MLISKCQVVVTGVEGFPESNFFQILNTIFSLLPKFNSHQGSYKQPVRKLQFTLKLQLYLSAIKQTRHYETTNVIFSNIMKP